MMEALADLPLSVILLLKGVAIGLAIAAPTGPVAVLCIKRTLLLGLPAGVASGLGAVVGDVFYGAIAAFGVAAVSSVLLAHEQILRIVGGGFLLWLGIKLLRNPPNPDARNAVNGVGLFAYFLSSVVLTVTNPLTIIGFTAIFAGFGVMDRALTLGDGAILLAGIALGAALWWLSLAAFASLFRRRLDAEHLTWLNRISGGLMLIFALGIAASFAL